MSCHLGIIITGGSAGISMMGDGSDNVQASNILDDYSVISLNATEQINKLLFRCVSGLGPSEDNTNDVIGNISFKNESLIGSRSNCKFVRATGASCIADFPGVYNARVCDNFTFTTSMEGVYTCTLMNSSMLYQSMRVGLYFRGRSKSHML